MKIGLWLQDHRTDSEKRFWEVMDIVGKSDVDLIVLPEFCWLPLGDLNGGDEWFTEAKKLAKRVGKPMIMCGEQYIIDDNEQETNCIFSFYCNPNPKDGETYEKTYVKHTMTGQSFFDMENYENLALGLINNRIIYQGKTIGMTICYDCNHAMFSRMYGRDGVDILINCTGGNVVYDKWYRFNRARAIENECFSFVTMGYNPKDENADSNGKINSYVYGFDGEGNAMSFGNLMNPGETSQNAVDTVYVYDTEKYNLLPPMAMSKAKANEKKDFEVKIGGVNALIEKSEKVKDGVFVCKDGDKNIVFLVIDGEDVMKPEVVCSLLYEEELKKYDKKRYVIVNKWKCLDENLFNKKLDLVLRVRSMENYCAVILESNKMNKCYQCGMNRTSQEVAEENGSFWLDLNRTAGLEAIWANKRGMRKEWRSGYEWLIDTLIN